jgi:formate dehydrogenase major subunit
LGDALQYTHCESCGMCISTCPTGALTENVLFKPGPVKTEPVETICNYCSVGCTLALNHRNGFVLGVSGCSGLVNTDGNLCRYGKFGYNYMNRSDRILKPLLRENGKFKSISFEDAFSLIKEKIKSVSPDENAFFAGGRLSNEELYLIQKLARASVKTNNVGSFHYLGRGIDLMNNRKFNVPFEDIRKASHIYFIGTEINKDHGVIGFIANNSRVMNNIQVSLVTVKERNATEHKVDEMIQVNSYYHFVKAMNHFILQNGLENGLFLDDRTEGFEEYKLRLLSEDYNELLKNAGITDQENFEKFATDYNKEMNAIIIFSEKEISAATSVELFNLAIITGKLGKTSNGLVSLKEKNNSQGLFDMGIHEQLGPGGVPVNDPSLVTRLKEKWMVDHLPSGNAGLLNSLEQGRIRNLFIFGEDPIGCSANGKIPEWIGRAGFKVVQDYFMTPTAWQADLVLPASFPAETGGSFTNAQKVIQEFHPLLPGKIEKSNLEQLTELLKKFGFEGLSFRDYIFEEIISLLPQGKDHSKIKLLQTKADDDSFNFHHGCDAVVRIFDEEFENKFKF